MSLGEENCLEAGDGSEPRFFLFGKATNNCDS